MWGWGVVGLVALGFVLGGFLVAVLADEYVALRRARRAWRDTVGLLRLQPQAVLKSIERRGHNRPVMGPCVVVSVTAGALVVQARDGGSLMAFRGRELEGLAITVSLSNSRGG